MRCARCSRVVVVLVGALLLTSACAAQPGGLPAPPPLPGMTPVPVAELVDSPSTGLSLSKDQVAAALLTAEDVPAGWTRSTDAAAAGDASDAGKAIGGATWDPASCQELATTGVPTADDVVDGVQFTTADQHTVLEMVTSWHGEDPKVSVDALRRIVAGCPTIRLTTPNGTVTEQMTPASVPAVGDDAAGYLCAAGVGGQVYSQTYEAVVIVGQVSVLLVASGPTMLDQALLDQLVTTSVTKAQAAAA